MRRQRLREFQNFLDCSWQWDEAVRLGFPDPLSPPTPSCVRAAGRTGKGVLSACLWTAPGRAAGKRAGVGAGGPFARELPILRARPSSVPPASLPGTWLCCLRLVISRSCLRGSYFGGHRVRRRASFPAVPEAVVRVTLADGFSMTR